ncbi:hypothetical protein, partial [Streptococcus pseudopneumoniae]|uniref:hypothetical protein n=1 Tax=Streptococcus pseudopneumoniae TaxID=257758 RepID=UPI0019D539F5
QERFPQALDNLEKLISSISYDLDTSLPTLSLNSPPTLLNPLVHLDFPTIFQLFCLLYIIMYAIIEYGIY